MKITLPVLDAILYGDQSPWGKLLRRLEKRLQSRLLWKGETIRIFNLPLLEGLKAERTRFFITNGVKTLRKMSLKN